MLLGRTAELDYLNHYFERDGSQIVVVYGTKQVGITSLLKEFSEGKPAYFYCARPCSEREQLYQWSKELAHEEICVLKYPTFMDIFEAISKEQRSKMVLILDEFQYFIKLCPSFLDDLLRFLHEHWNDKQFLVVLSSNAVGWIENNMIQKIKEAAYELSGLLKIKELQFSQLVSYFPNYTYKECVETYSILGGIPGLWSYFRDDLSISQNIINTFLNPACSLFSMADSYAQQELREPAVYNTILSAIAEGKHKLNELYLHTGFSRAKISVYIKNLMELEIVEKVFSVDTLGKENTQKGIYRIRNKVVHFYFKFIYPNLSSFYVMRKEVFYQKFIAPELKNYVAIYFKEICTQYLKEENEKISANKPYEYMGEWVGKAGSIDALFKGQDGKTLVVLCNYEKPMMTYEDYEALLFNVKSAKVQVGNIYLFSIAGFDEKLSLEAKVKKNLTLISFGE